MFCLNIQIERALDCKVFNNIKLIYIFTELLHELISNFALYIGKSARLQSLFVGT